MRGEFEKQVKQKMEELQLTPSVPVWEKIQMEIRPEKDRRRLLLWLPVCVLLLGGSAWWMLHLNMVADKATANHGSSVQTYPHQPQKQGDQRISTEKVPENKTPSPTIRLTPQVINRIRESNADRQRNAFTTALQKARVAHSVAVGWSNPVKINPGSNSTPVVSPQFSPSVSSQPDNHVPETSELKPAVLPGSKAEKESKADSAFVNPLAPAPKPHSKWTFGITAFSGLSGVTTGNNVFTKSLTAELSRVAPYANTAVVYIPPATERNNTSLGFGIAATRSVYRRLLFTTGLQYSFYSTRINVGQKISSGQLASYSSPGVIPVPSVPSSYYTKTINGSDYINRYHFLSIPIGLQYQLFRRTPLFLSASVSAQRLIGTNALQYDNQSQIYYEDNDNLKKTLLFSDFGVYYSMIRSKKLSIQLGPEFHYGITEFKKQPTDNSHHVFSMGVSSKILFHK